MYSRGVFGGGVSVIFIFLTLYDVIQRKMTRILARSSSHASSSDRYLVRSQNDSFRRAFVACEGAPSSYQYT